jgi:hypothetical protein
LPDVHAQQTSREGATVEVEQVYSVFTSEISLYLVAVLVEQVIEAR